MKLLLQIVAVLVLLRWPMMLMMSPMALAAPDATNHLRPVRRLILILAYPLAIGVAFYWLDWGLLWMSPKTVLIVTGLAGSLGAVIYGSLLFNIVRGVSNSGYTIKPNAVYYSGSKIKKADPGTFEEMPEHRHYARDKQQVYRMGKVIQGADPATFQPLSESGGTYGIDQANVYFELRMIDGADVATFERLVQDDRPTVYWRDRNRVYLDGKTLSCDAAMFQTQANTGFVRDKDHVYYYDTMIDGADVTSFEVLSENIAKDKRRIYRERGAILPMANAAAFRLIGGERFAMDDKQVYFIPYYFKCEAMALQQVDPGSFTVLGSHYAKDSSTVYYTDNNELTPVIDADAKTFVLLDRTVTNDAKDCRREYLRGKAV